jgi:hypothetical protein
VGKVALGLLFFYYSGFPLPIIVPVTVLHSLIILTPDSVLPRQLRQITNMRKRLGHRLSWLSYFLVFFKNKEISPPC